MKNILFALSILFVSQQSIAQPKLIEGKVIEIIDGDTFKLLTEEGTYNISVAGVGCPELMQPFGDKAKQFTSEAILNKFVRVTIFYSGPKGQFMGIVDYDSSKLSSELLRNGLAWHFAESSNNSTFLQSLEDEARSNKIGLWQEANPINPKVWREANSVYPIYPGCEKKQNNAERKKCMSDKIQEFVNKNFRMNLVGNLDLDDGLQKVAIEFNINKEGNIEDVEVRATHPWLEKEAIRIFKKLPKIKPMLVIGKPTVTSYRFPIKVNVKK